MMSGVLFLLKFKNILKLLALIVGLSAIFPIYLILTNRKINFGRHLANSDKNTTQSETPVNVGKRNTYIYTNYLYDKKLRAKKALEITDEMVQRLEIPPKESSFVELSEQMLQDFVFVTASSSNHFNQSLDLVGSIQTYYPDNDIYYYDIGLEDEQIEKIKTMCHVNYKLFDFEAYPPHVSIIKTYAFKPLIIKEMMKDHNVGVFWVDASIRIKKGGTDVLWKKIKKGKGLVLFISKFLNPIFSVTHPDMYDYLPANTLELKQRKNYGCGALLIYNTRFIYEHFFKWFLLCALNAPCITPVDATRHCDKVKNRNVYRNCHRYDQSSMNILVNNMYNFPGNFQSEICDMKRLFVAREVTNMFEVNLCF